MDPVVRDLDVQNHELRHILEDLADGQWHAPTRCEGWEVCDVVTHLSQSNEMAVGSLEGRYEEVLTNLTSGLTAASSVDEGAAAMVARERNVPITEQYDRWRQNAERLVDSLNHTDLSSRVLWVTGELSARSLATTRLAETWIHSGDIADGVGISLRPNEGLRNIARLAWRTLPYAFSAAGRSMQGPVAFDLRGPSGEIWSFLPDEPALTTISGPAIDLCEVAARRKDASATALLGVGPDVDDVLTLVRTYA
jgi:uncharacterized protein (TIGR03084 family)